MNNNAMVTSPPEDSNNAAATSSPRDPKDIIRTLALPELSAWYHNLIPVERRVCETFIASLSDQERMEAIRACILVFLLSQGKAVPRDFQLAGALGSLAGRDGIIASGTGSGKTLIMVILHL